MSLDSLRKLRAQTEEALTMELAQITQKLVRIEQQCRTLEAKINSETATYRLQTEQGLAIEAMLEWQGRMGSQRAAFKRVRRGIDELTEAWTSTQARLVEATQERKVLDRLAERQREAHRVEGRRQEQRATDEAASRQRSFLGDGLS